MKYLFCFLANSAKLFLNQDDGGGLLQDGPVFLHNGPQGDHIWVKVVPDNGLEIAP